MNWLKRVLEAVIKAFFFSGGNTAVAEVAAAKEVASIAVEEVTKVVTHHEKAGKEAQTVKQAGEVVTELGTSDGEQLPGPTTFDKPVDQVYGRNRKH